MSGSADNQAGDPIANWLITHSEEIGIQYIIWDRTQWTAERAVGTKGRRYGGAHPHNDHLHIELSSAAGNAQTDWFSGSQEPPVIPTCERIAIAGSVLDNDSLCLTLHGDSRYWRNEEGVGEGGSLLWTNAFRSANPSNWAQWQLSFEQAGHYNVEVFLDPSHAQFASTHYRVHHESQVTDIEVDQGSASGWRSLGTFDFATDGGQSLSILDNTSQTPNSERSIAIDAIRFTLAN